MSVFDSHDQIVHMKKIQAEGLELFIKKNADYGNSYKQYGLIGVLVRLQDKINRALHITQHGIHVKDESLRDTLIDLHNYAAMALMESEQSPGSNSEPTVPNLPIHGSEPPVSNTESLKPLAIELPQVRKSISDPPRKRYQTLDFDITFNEAYEECNHRNINLRS
jgi:hypothetical protein